MTLSRRGWGLAGLLWLVVALLQGPGLTVADTKHDLTADPWGFLSQALSPWTDVFPLGQLQNQAYGYLFPQGLFFALLDPLPDWVTQRLWWALLLFLAFAGALKLLEATATGSRLSRLVAAVLFALSPRILTTLGAISSEAWTVALVPWIMLPVVRILAAGPRPTTRRVATAALGSGVAVLCLGAVNAVATLAAVVPAVLWWLAQGVFAGGAGAAVRRRTAWRFAVWWIPAGVLACFWWVGPLLILGRYSPPFTDYIEAAGLTTHWFNLGEVLRGTTSWTAFLSTEREAGFALATEAIFVAATLAVALLGLAGLARGATRSRPSRPMPFAGTWLLMLGAGVLVFGVAASPFSPVAGTVQSFLDGAGAPLRNLHKFDALVHLPLIAGFAHLLGGLSVPRERAAWLRPEHNRPVVACTAVALVVAVACAPAWTGRLVPEDGFRQVPGYWQQAADWLNDPANGAADSRTMILPEARTARQTWGNTRDEPAQALLDVPWVVRDAVPLVPPEAIRGLDGLQREVVAEGASGANPALADAMAQQGVGFVLVRTDLARTADTPGARAVLRTLTDSAASDGFSEVADFGAGGDGSDGGDIRIFRVNGTDGTDAAASGPRVVNAEDLEVTAGGPEVLPRLAAADAAAGRSPRDRILRQDLPDDSPDGDRNVDTVTDTPALREHNYGNVVGAESDIRSVDDARDTRNPARDYPTGLDDSELTQVRESNGRITASSSASDPTSLGGAQAYSGPSAAVDGVAETAWRPGTGSPINQTLTLDLARPVSQMSLDARAAGSPVRVQATTYLDGDTVASTTMLIPGYREASDSDRPLVLPSGEADRVELRIVGSWGDPGLGEIALTEMASGQDVTPRRDIIVPAGDTGAGVPDRWVLGQEIYEFELRRTITVPDADAPVTVQVDSDRCAADEDTVSSIDGVPVTCGDTVELDAGEHEIRSQDRWIALNMQDGATTQDAAASGDGAASDASGDRVVVTSTAVNDGRAAELGGTALDSVTVNGWQQGWVVPAGLADDMNDEEITAALDVHFTATDTYQRWLGAGLLGALVLLLGWVTALWTTRRHGSRTSVNDSPAASTTGDVSVSTETLSGGPHSLARGLLVGTGVLALSAVLGGVAGVGVAAATMAVSLAGPALVNRLPASGKWPTVRRAVRWVSRPTVLAMVLGGIATALMIRSPWGSGDYAGYSWTVQLLFLACLVATACGQIPVKQPEHRGTPPT